MKPQKTLRFWNGRGHGKYENSHINVSAYSRKQAGELLSIACECRIGDSEMKNYYAEVWGNDMKNIIVETPCVFISPRIGKEIPKLVLQVQGEQILQIVPDKNQPVQNTNNCISPLMLKYNDGVYNVNKPLDQSGEYVDKKIADAMYEALKAIDNDMPCFPQDVQDKMTNAIAKAEGKI